MSLIIAMCLFALSMSISPGPVNLLTLSSGVNFGVRKTMPFVSGAVIGFIVVLLSVGLGIGAVVGKSLFFLNILCVIGSGFIGYMGIKLIKADLVLEVKDEKLPTFIQGFLLQCLNPKAWVASIAGISAFNLADDLTLLLVFVSLYFCICYLSIACWALVGNKLSFYINDVEKLKLLNNGMGILLIAIALYLGFANFYW